MTSVEKKAPKKVKDKKRTPEEQLALSRYNHMMYGPTAGELRVAPKKVNYGPPYLKHPKFQSLMAAFKIGSDYKFEVSEKGKTHTISTTDSQILFNDRVIYYCRPLNKYEQNLLMDRSSVIHYQANEAFVHLVFAVIQSFPDLGPSSLAYKLNQFYLGAETLEAGIAQQGPNLLMGSFRHLKAQEKK